MHPCLRNYRTDMSEDDSSFKLVDRICDELFDRTRELGIESLTDVEKPILLAWSADGFICNGGFRYFFEGFGNIYEVAAAYSLLGLEKRAEACRRAGELIPLDLLIPGDEVTDKRIDFMGNEGEELEKDIFDEVDDLFFDNHTHEALVAAVAEYIAAKNLS
jgi:Domain of unknown function (DUF4375)